MSITRTYTVHCDLPSREHPADHHGVSSCTGWTGETIEGAKGARRIASVHGWQRIDGKDYCPAGAEIIWWDRQEEAHLVSDARGSRR